MTRSFTALAVLLLLALTAGCQQSEDVQLVSRTDFRCYAATESMRTIGHARHKRKTGQIARIERLLTHKLEALDEAKLRSEMAVLRWEVADIGRQRDCAEAYYEPGSTKLRQGFADDSGQILIKAPKYIDYGPIERNFNEAFDKVPKRMQPHGFAERAALHMAEAALAQGRMDEAIKRAGDYLEDDPRGLYTDSLKLVLADALLHQGERARAVVLYKDVGELRIGIDAQYARYRLSRLLDAEGQQDEAKKLFDDVVKWAERGGREAMHHVLTHL